MKVVVIGLAAALSLAAGVSHAAQVAGGATLTGSYSVTALYNYADGGAAITPQMSTPMNIALTINSATAATNFFTVSPSGGTSNGTQCAGNGCNTSTFTETDPITVTFSNLSLLGITLPTETAKATFTAKYSGAILPCAFGDKDANGNPKSPSTGQTDCVVWAGANNVYNGSTTQSYNLGNGYALDIILNNATDWNVTPTVSFEYNRVPEPATLALLGTALAGLGVMRRRRKAG